MGITDLYIRGYSISNVDITDIRILHISVTTLYIDITDIHINPTHHVEKTLYRYYKCM